VRWLMFGASVLILVACLLFARRGSEHGDPMMEASWSETSMPQTPAGRQVDGYLQAFNSGNELSLVSYVRDHFTAVGPGGSSLEDRIGSQQRLYNSSRGLNVLEAMERTPNELELLAQFRLTEEWRQITFMIEDSPLHKISGVRIVPTDAPTISDQINGTSLRTALTEYLTRLVKADQFSSVVVIARNGDTVIAEPYGHADQDHNTLITLDTPFQYASVGKMFTAVAIGQLAEAGKLNFNDTLDKYLPEYPAEAARRITIDDLLTHRSGIVDYFEALERLEKIRSSQNPQRDYLSVFANEPLRFTPGERFEYSNSNYILLGAIVERISGQLFGDFRG
jgi:D-alanyl-D-alanine carboxypeptidase